MSIATLTWGAGVIGGPILGVAFDRSILDTVEARAPSLAAAATAPGGFMWMSHEKIDPRKADAIPSTKGAL